MYKKFISMLMLKVYLVFYPVTALYFISVIHLNMHFCDAMLFFPNPSSGLLKK